MGHWEQNRQREQAQASKAGRLTALGVALVALALWILVWAQIG